MSKSKPKAVSGQKPGKTREATYNVGKGKPPKEHQFQRGQSGNPNGRRSASAADPKLSMLEERHKLEFLEEMYETIELTRPDGKIERISKFKLLIRSLFKAAAQGDRHAAIKLLDYLSLIEREHRDAHLETVQLAIEYKRKMRRVLDKAEKENRPPPELELHPDDIIVDETIGDVSFRDPTIRRIYDQLGALSDRQFALAKGLTGNDEKDAPVRKQLDAIRDQMAILEHQLDEKYAREDAARKR